MGTDAIEGLRANRRTDAAPASSATPAASNADAAAPITATCLPRNAAKSMAASVWAYSVVGRPSLTTAGTYGPPFPVKPVQRMIFRVVSTLTRPSMSRCSRKCPSAGSIRSSLVP